MIVMCAPDACARTRIEIEARPQLLFRIKDFDFLRGAFVPLVVKGSAKLAHYYLRTRLTQPH